MSKLGQILHDPFANRLAVFAGALIVITWGLLGLDFWLRNVQGVAAASEQAAATAQALDERVVRTLSVADQFLKLVSKELMETNSWSETRVVTHSLRRLDPLLDEIMTISFVNALGISIGHSSPTMPVGSSYMDSDFFRAHAAAPNLGLFVEKPQLGQTSGQRVFTVSRRISAANGGFLGVLVAVIRIDALAADFADSTIGKKGATMLFHIPSARIIVHQPDYHGSFGKTMPYSNLQEVLSHAPNGVFKSDDSLDGEERIFAYRRINDLPLAVSVGLATSEIRANLMREFAGYLMMTLLLSAIIGGGAVYVLAAYQREIGLQESMRRWQLIFEHAGWGMVVISADGKTLQQMNPAFALMHGYSVEELTGQPIEMVLANEARNNLHEYCAQNHKAGHRHFESLHKHRNDRVFPVLIDATTISGKAGEVLYRVVSVKDISEIRHAQNEIRIANEIFQHTFNDATVGMVISDVNGRYTRVNRAMCELTGYSESELLTMSYVDITHPEDIERNVRTRQSLMEGQCRSFQVEKRYVRKDGREVWALVVVSLVTDTEGKPLYLIGQILDIDAQKRAEQRLRLSEERFRGIFENANTGIAASDKTGRLIYFNEAFRSMLGYDSVALKQMHFADFSFPEDSARDRVLLDEITMRLREKYRIEKRFIARDGEILWVDLYVSTIRDDTDDIVNFICIVNDITERKESALALADSRQQLRALAAYQEETFELERKHIAREVHDELGQLLTALKMDISLVRLHYGKNLELLGRVDEMRSLVDRTINVVRQVSSNLRPAALDHGLTPAIEWLAENFTKRWLIHCRLDVGDSESEIVLNDQQSTAVFRIVQESLTNIARHAQASEVVISLHTIGQRLQVIVKDDGHGFAMEAVGKGRGFGLLGMSERVLALGGTLHIDSVPGKGTSVTIELSLSNSEHS